MDSKNPQPSSIVIKLDDVCFAYNHEEVLHNINIELTAGSFVGVVGPNGGGKSTLLKLILGLISPVRGDVYVFEKEPIMARKDIGYVPQHLSFDAIFPVTVLDVVLMGRVDRHLTGPYNKDDKEAAFSTIEQVGLSSLTNRRFSELSGGERQRVLIAQALISSPKLLLLDEPTANVDREVERKIYELLNRLNEKITVVVVSHNLNVVTCHSSHVTCINRTASTMAIEDFTKDALHAVYQGDMAVLHHEQCCQVIDPTASINTPHHREYKDNHQ